MRTVGRGVVRGVFWGLIGLAASALAIFLVVILPQLAFVGIVGLVITLGIIVWFSWRENTNADAGAKKWPGDWL